MTARKEQGPTWLMMGKGPWPEAERAFESIRTGIGTMPCISVRQPFASALVAGVKDCENRGWAPAALRTAVKAGKPWWCAITSGREWWGDNERELDSQLVAMKDLWPEMPPRVLMVRGAVLGAVAFGPVVEVAKQSDKWRALHPWASGPLAWTVTDAIKLDEPRAYRGAQGVLRLDAITAGLIRDAWRESR